MFPKTLDYYQVELTRMLETERYADAAELLRFLLKCEVQDPRHYDEWGALLNWLNEAFPASSQPPEKPREVQAEEEEGFARRRAEMKFAEDKGYAERLLQTVTEKPLSEHTFLALEQLSFIQAPEIDETLRKWLESGSHHPVLEFRVLQTLRKRGGSGSVELPRAEEHIGIDIESVPLGQEDFPAAVQNVLDRVAQEAQVHNPALFYFAQEFWYQFIMGVYGTSDYRSILSEVDASLDVWAAALHKTVTESLQGNRADEEIRTAYGITDSLRLRFEQAYRSMKQFAARGAMF
nr:hypothetical protein [Paenibacillus caui]